MPLQRLEHYLVLSDDIHRTRDFYRDVLGMAEGFRPELDFPGTFNGTGFAELRGRLVARGLEFSENSLDDDCQDGRSAANAGAICGHRLKQMFLRDPNGVPLEINFRS